MDEIELFKLEYWSLEQAKLAGQKFLPLTGQVVIATGGAGAIGAATAAEFARNGAHVVVADIDEGAAMDVAEQIGNHAIAVAGDVTRADDVRRVFGRAVKQFGGVDIVVSNAAPRSRTISVHSPRRPCERALS